MNTIHNTQHTTHNTQHLGRLELLSSFLEENKILERLDGRYIEISEMLEGERRFLNSLILRNRPVKLLEIGVSSGASSIVMLNAIKEISGAHLFSIDYNTNWYRNSEKKTGYFVENYSELKEKWTLRTGGLSLKFIEEIGNEIDFCLIDTVHFNPGEIFDFLMIFPFLKSEAIVVFHDIKYHTFCMEKESRWREQGITNNLLMSAIYGKKIVESIVFSHENIFPNIGAIKTSEETAEHIFEIFNLLTMKWTYLPTEEEEQQIICFFERYYEKSFLDYLKDVFAFHRRYWNLVDSKKKNIQKITLKYLLKKILVKIIK